MRNDLVLERVWIASSQLVLPWPLLPWMMLSPDPQKIFAAEIAKIIYFEGVEDHQEILAYDSRL